MKPKIVVIIVVLAALAAFSGRALAREIQTADDRGGQFQIHSSLLRIKGASELGEVLRMQVRGSVDMPGEDKEIDKLLEDRPLSSRGTDDLQFDDRGQFSQGADDLPGDDHGKDSSLISSSNLESSELEPGDDKGGTLTPTTSPTSSLPQPIDDKGGHGGGSDDPSGQK